MARKRTTAEKYAKTVDPRAMYWLMRRLAGETYVSIARDVGIQRQHVAENVKRAAAKMVDAAQEKVLDELFPVALELYKAKMEQQIADIRSGKPDVSVEIAERILKGMFVLDAPQLKDQVAATPSEAQPSVETLTGLMLQRRTLRGQPEPSGQLPPSTSVDGEVVK
jgi:hypothetical protein